MRIPQTSFKLLIFLQLFSLKINYITAYVGPNNIKIPKILR